MEFRKHFLGKTEHPAWGIWSWQLELAGFSRQQIADLNKVKALYQQEVYHEATPEQRRLEFVRWLYQQHRLQS
ncbi:MAG TPA: hypothetical protein VF026_28320 [Ktedonobacteraceae bacterium]